MIRLAKGPKPPVLAANETAWAADYAGYRATGAPRTAAKRYRHREIKEALRRETHDKCAYCESKVSHVYPGDAEHILPKSVRPDLVVSWENLTYVCALCNGAKRDYYDPELPLVNPYADEPSEHLRFYGPMCFETLGSASGRMTAARLQLSRVPLIERRRERLESVHTLVRLWDVLEPGALKDAVREDIVQLRTSDKEYSAAVGAFLDALGF